MNLVFDVNAVENASVRALVSDCLTTVRTFEGAKPTPLTIYQDGKSKGYYIKCNILASDATPVLDLNAKLNPTDAEGFRANRELHTEHNTYKRMVEDAKAGREFNDIIVEYSKEYSPEKPLKIWGGQHRARAIQQAHKEKEVSRVHGFRIFFDLSKEQRTDLALTSNTNINVSNDLFDRLLEETRVGINLREWCYETGLLKKPEDFPDQGSRAERITVKLARTFVTNFYLGKDKRSKLKDPDVDKNVYEPHLCESGSQLDAEYDRIVTEYGQKIWSDHALMAAGLAFAEIHKAQHESVKDSAAGKKMKNLKGFRNKAMTESVLSAWAFVAGLLQGDARLDHHLLVPKTAKGIPDPLNAREMSTFSHDSDDPTYRGLGTRSAVKDRQRMAQLFLARSRDRDLPIDRSLMNKAVSQVVAIKSLEKGYTA